MSKFRKGDRVVYHCDGTGNPDLHGQHGKIIGVDRSSSPYTVQFDRAFWGAMEDMRFGGKKGHCWCCTESHLEKEDGGADDGSSDHRINEKEKQTMAKESMWTDEMDARLLSMKAEGKSYEEMAAEMNVEYSTIKNRLYYLKKVKGKYGVTDKAEPDTGAAEKAETMTQPEGLTHSEEPQEKEQEGELNDLEKALAETITEQRAEIDRLKGEVKDLEDRNREIFRDNLDKNTEIVALGEKVRTLESELQDTATTLAQTENQLDVEVEAMRSAAAELEKAKSAETEYQSMIEAYAIVKVDQQNRLNEKDERIAELEAENKRLLKLIVGLTEERLESHAS